MRTQDELQGQVVELVRTVTPGVPKDVGVAIVFFDRHTDGAVGFAFNGTDVTRVRHVLKKLVSEVGNMREVEAPRVITPH